MFVPSVRAPRVHRIGLAALASLLLVDATPAAAQATLDCGEPLCAAVIDMPEAIYSGALLTFRVGYRFQEGDYPEGLRIDIESPEYFVAANVPETDVWRPYLVTPPATAAKVCAIEAANPWDVTCGLERAPFSIANNVDPGAFTVSLHSQPYDTPKDYLASFAVTISGRRVYGGVSTFESHTATATVRVRGEANPNLFPWSQIQYPVGHPDRAISEGLTAPIPGSQGFVPDLDAPGEQVRGVLFTISQTIRNRVMPRGALNDDGNLYSPSLADDAWFDTDVVHPTGGAAGTPGSNALHDVRYELELPDWVRFYAATSTIQTAFMNDLVIPVVGARGGLVAGTVKTPIGTASPITQALYASSPAPPASLSQATGAANTTFLIPCDLLATLDTDPTTVGVQLAPERELFRVRLSGRQKIFAADGTVSWVDHTLDLPPWNPFFATNLATSCPRPGIGNANLKGGTSAASEVATAWSVNFFAPTNYVDGFGDFAVVDFIPPYQQLRQAPTGSPQTVAGDPWLCVLPRPAMTRPAFTAPCPEVGTTTDSSIVDPLNPNRFVCASGTSFDHRYDPSVNFDPLPLSMDTPFDEGGLAWDGTQGCVRAAQVCMHPTTRLDYGTCAVGADDKVLWAHEITTVIWRSDDATSPVDGWRAAPDANGSPQVAPSLAFALPVWNTPLVPELTTAEDQFAWVLNHMRFYGAAFDPDGAGPAPTQSLGNGDIDTDGDGTRNFIWNTTPYGRLLVDNRFHLTPYLFNTETRFVARGQSLPIGSALTLGGNYGLAPVDDLELRYDLPVGFDPGDNAGSTTPTRLTRPLAVPPNPVGLTGPLADAFVILPPLWSAPVPATIDEFDISLHWITPPTGAGYWQYRFKRNVPSRGFSNAGLAGGIRIAVRPRADHPFVDGVANKVRLSATATNYDRPDDGNRDDFPEDANDWVTTTFDVYVPMTASLSVVTTPTCVPGRATPSFVVDFANTSGVNQTGLGVIFTLPEPGAIRSELAAVRVEAVPSGTSPVVQVSTTSYDALASDLVWTPLADYAGPMADVKLVRLAFGAAETTPAYYAGGRFVVDLVHPDATLADLGRSITAEVNIGSTQVALSNSLPSAPFTVGECPLPLPIVKWLDEDRDGAPDGGEPPLPGVDFELTVTGGLDGVPDEPQAATTDAEGRLVFEVWPGQIPTVTEPLPAPIDVAIASFPDDGGTLTWAATTPGGATRTGPVVGFAAPPEMAFGNMCTCTTDNLCVDAGPCVVEFVAAPGDGEPPVTAACTFTPKEVACDPGDADVCEVATGSCDPATGACGFVTRTCQETEPTRIYVTVEDDEGPIGVARCWVEPGAGAVTCDTREEDGETVLDILPELLCGAATDGE